MLNILIEVLKIIYAQYIQTGKIDVLLTFYLSQDLLESLFGRMRAMLGRNDNPTASQFSASFRAVVIHTEITSSEFSNCEDAPNILSISSTAKPPKPLSLQDREFSNSFNSTPPDSLELFDDSTDTQSEPSFSVGRLTKYEIGTVSYFAGQIEKKKFKIEGSNVEMAIVLVFFRQMTKLK